MSADFGNFRSVMPLNGRPMAVRAGVQEEPPPKAPKAIAEGKVPYTPQQEMSDIVATKNDQSFSDAQEERAAVAKEVSFVLRTSATPHLNPPAPHQSCQHDLSSA